MNLTIPRKVSSSSGGHCVRQLVFSQKKGPSRLLATATISVLTFAGDFAGETTVALGRRSLDFGGRERCEVRAFARDTQGCPPGDRRLLRHLVVTKKLWHSSQFVSVPHCHFFLQDGQFFEI